MSLADHRLRLQIERDPIDTSSFGEGAPPQSTVDIDVRGGDLKAVWDELLQRLPGDTYQALVQAMRERYDDEGSGQ
jgi:hypothetical protein